MADVQLDMASFRELFMDEANEHVAALEQGLLQLEDTPADIELLNQIFRAAHSLKGGSASFGFQSITRLTHVLESLLDPMREGKVALSDVLASLLLRSVDVLKGLLEAVKDGAPDPESFAQVLRELEQQLEQLELAGGERPQSAPHRPRQTGTGTYEVTFAPGAELFRQGTDPILVLRNLGELGTVLSTHLDSSALPSLDSLDPERCYLRWSIFLETRSDETEIRDVFAFVEDSSQIGVSEGFRDWSVDDPEINAVFEDTVSAQGAQTEEPTAGRATGRTPSKASTLRVSTDKIDKLVDLVGELVIAQSMVTQALNDRSKDGLARAQEVLVEMVGRTRELQERVLAVRMVPVGSIFNRFPRLVRDLGAQCQKKARLVMSGQEIEIDKSIVEEIADPLTHLLRNAIDHGLESPEERVRAGKPEEGVIRLSAFHQGGSVIVEVSEDGRGLNTAKIREKGVALGLVRPGDELSDDQIHALIFEPGFSTAAAVTDVSGRGVGMDVVRRNVDALNGSIAISSLAGLGTSVRVKLPLTLAIMDGLSFRIGREVFVLPLLPIVESVRPTKDQLKTVMGQGELLRMRGESIPLVRLYRELNIEPEETDPCRALVVIVETGATKLGLLVDELLGQAQVVVKSLELNYRKVDAVMGATILGTGNVALILDVEGLARRMLTGSRPHQAATSSERALQARRPELQHEESSAWG